MSINDAGVSAARAALRHDWTREEIQQIYRQALPDLLFSAQQAHRQFHDPTRVQFCQLLSVKTGGCPEDCSYCPQSAHYSTEVTRGGLLPVDEVLEFAKRARGEGATRFCMGAAWRNVQEGEDFENILKMVRGVAEFGMEVCCSLGMLDDSQAQRLAEAGLTAYNHNLDTSPEFYGQIITTRNYDDRLRTLASVRKAGVTVCCGGIIGLGESENDRIGLLQQLSTLNPHPESVPINALVRVTGTPLEQIDSLDPLVFVRTIATARILMPSSMVRLSAGRKALSREAVALCFVAGANSLFIGEKLLTTANPEPQDDMAMLQSLGLEPLPLH
ncbi:MAG TPA: biotin synthase BioB [Candidatus Saccharimonadales bacterium]|nr:biotin synthase BioB [Candidatus Saccharimonadales bacterium]